LEIPNAKSGGDGSVEYATGLSRRRNGSDWNRSEHSDKLRRVIRLDTMNVSKRKPLTAWLGLIAMWLIVFAPMVSQLVAHAHADAPAAALCSAVQPDGGEHHAPFDQLSACGYCDLLADHVAVPHPPAALWSIVLVVAFTAAPVLSTRFTPLGAFPSGRPRAPPASPQSSL
jgi:hypothetical protein